MSSGQGLWCWVQDDTGQEDKDPTVGFRVGPRGFRNSSSLISLEWKKLEQKNGNQRYVVSPHKDTPEPQ